MKALAPFASLFVVAAALHQAQLPGPLAASLQKTSDAKSLSVTYTMRVVGDVANDYKLTMSKPNMYRLETPNGFELADGTNVYKFDKKKNSYTVQAETDATLTAFMKKRDVLAWSGFFAKTPGDSVLAAVSKPDQTVKGTPVKVFEVSLKGAKDPVDLFIDPTNGLAKGFDESTGGKEYLAVASKVDAGDDPLTSDKFAFVAPDGAVKAEANAVSVAFADIQTILTDNCMPCHNSDNKRAGIDLTNYAGVSAAVTAGDAPNSLLVKAIHGNGVDLMPKGRAPLTDDQIHVIEQWVTDGAKQG